MYWEASKLRRICSVLYALAGIPNTSSAFLYFCVTLPLSLKPERRVRESCARCTMSRSRTMERSAALASVPVGMLHPRLLLSACPSAPS